MSIKSLIINPGSTSTKLGIFEDETLVMDETLRHSTEEIAKYASIIDQKDFRKNIIGLLRHIRDLFSNGRIAYSTLMRSLGNLLHRIVHRLDRVGELLGRSRALPCERVEVARIIPILLRGFIDQVIITAHVIFHELQQSKSPLGKILH